MVNVGNNIKVVFKKYVDKVKYDVTGGEMILHNNSEFLDINDSYVNFLLQNYIFSGILLDELPENIKIIIEDVDGGSSNFVIYKGYIYVQKKNPPQTEIFVLRFVPAKKHWAGDYFYGHFIEKN